MMKSRQVALACSSIGLGCLAAFEFMDSHVGADGHLHEFFALQATGILLLLVAALTEAVGWGRQLWYQLRAPKR
jgi:hypothetical protein